MVVPGIHGPPAVSQVDLKPGAEVHGRIGWRDPDIAQISGNVARGYVHGPAKGNGQVLKVPADADPLGKDIQRGLGGAGVLIAESDLGIDPAANRVDPAPTGGKVAEQLHGNIGEAVHLAIAAVEQINESLVRQVGHGMLSRLDGRWILQAGVLNQGGIGQPHMPGGSYKSRAAIAEHIDIAGDGDWGIQLQFVRFEQVRFPRRMHMQHPNDGDWSRNIETNVITSSNLHHPLDRALISELPRVGPRAGSTGTTRSSSQKL